MLANPEQRLTFNNVSQECFGNLNACKNGYTLKLWFCLTNYNGQVFKTPNTYVDFSSIAKLHKPGLINQNQFFSYGH